MRTPREPLNFYTHAIPALLAIPAAAVLFYQSNTNIQFTAAIVYGLCTFVLFSMSAIYHSYPQTPKQIRAWQKADHCSIYLMIAGSYTPTILLVFNGWIRWTLLATIWTIALLGCSFKIANRLRHKGISLSIYIAMGALIAPLIDQVAIKLSLSAIMWLLIGGVFYIAGTIFYYKDKELNKYLHTHEVWHLFVIAGATSHYFYNYQYLFV
ncbi:MAG: hemolysin III family protein [Sphingobacteriaceae bacterium]|jgi:hemolysin III|nr:MAG: hemolysin III family protein [Pedobacter sp.]